MPAKPTTIDEYLAPLPESQGTALEQLRKTIKAIVPQAEECIYYGFAAFRQGKILVGFGAADKHLAFYPCSGSTTTTLKDELKEFECSKGAMRFTIDRLIPDELVRKVIMERIRENGD